MLDSLSTQLEEQDCLTIVYDGHSEIPSFNTENFTCKVQMYCEPTALGYWGHAIRNKYAHILDRRDFVMHADDDDMYFPDVFSKLRAQCIDTNTLYIAKMQFSSLQTVPTHNSIYVTNIGTPCGIIPFDQNKKAQWMHEYGGDGKFYMELAKHVKPVFLNTVMYKVR
jgi:hypothetical protein